jgi:hypothetical protein
MGASGRANQAGLVVAALALLAGAPDLRRAVPWDGLVHTEGWG